MRQVNDPLGIERLVLYRCHDPVGNDVVKIRRSCRAGIAEIGNRDRSRAVGKHADGRTIGEATQVYGDIDFVLSDAARYFQFVAALEVVESVKRLLNSSPQWAGVVGAEGCG